jgi:predicted phosphodiesterase
MKLWAISDLHVSHPENRRVVETLPAHRNDWLVLAGDTGETVNELRFVLEALCPRFARVLWVPGNHELWTMPAESARAPEKYEEFVALCQEYGVMTPEDPYELFSEGLVTHLIAPLFTLYDYSFCPEGMTAAQARAWALETNIECADEHLLHPEPYPSREAWCRARCETTEARLTAALETHQVPTVLISHFPLHAELARLPLIPRFSIWCGTRRTNDWHRRFRASVVVFGHLHIRQTRLFDGVRFEEVSLGYPRQWRRRPADGVLREILPGGRSLQFGADSSREELWARVGDGMRR